MDFQSMMEGNSSCRIWIKDMEVGQEIQGIYAVHSAQLRSYSNGEFMSLRIGDRTGKISAIYWDADQKLYRKVLNSPLVQIKGRVQTYQGQLQLSLSKVGPVKKDEPINEADFLPTSPIDPQQLIQKMKSWRDSLSTEHYRRLWDLFFEDEEPFNLFSSAPAGKRWHHPYLGGLLEHTESLIQLCDYLARQYPVLNRDLLLSGALFHDTGKAWELIYRTTFDYSDEGRLIGHIVLGVQLVQKYLEQVPDFPADQGLLLQHLILAHQGDTPESPRLPRCREAMVLHYADMIDSQLAAFTREIESPESIGATWTPFVKLINRHLYRGSEKAASEEAKNSS